MNFEGKLLSGGARVDTGGSQDSLSLRAFKQQLIDERASRPDVYRSPAERLRSERVKPYQTMQFTGNVNKLFNDLKQGGANEEECDPSQYLALHPPRIIRAAVDWKIAHPKDAGEPYIAQAIDVGLAVYQKAASAGEHVVDLQKRWVKECPDLLDANVSQKIDFATWKASDPQRSYATAREIAELTDGEDVTFIALGHGGTAPGMDIFLRYTDITASTDSSMQVVRYSREKKGDQQPQASETETQQLRALAEGNRSHIILFDEDTNSGATLRKAKEYFESTVFPQKNVHVFTNFTPPDPRDSGN